MIDADILAKLLAGHLPRQRWFAGAEGETADVAIKSMDLLRPEWPALVQVLIDAEAGGRGSGTWQVVVGLRPGDGAQAFLDGRPEAVLGEIETDQGPALAYDAALDPELALHLLAHIAPDEHAEHARPLGADQSNTSLVYDERLVLKLFRRLGVGQNLDAEVVRALVSVGFTSVPRPVAEWRRGDSDFALVSEFLVGAADGFSLAVTSLRDLYHRRSQPDEAGGDFAPDARRLGTVTAHLHLALARAFGTEPAEPGAWADRMEAHLSRVRLEDVDPGAVRTVYERLRNVDDPGPALRVHGDYHLGQVLRTDTGWFVLDFEGEPDRPPEERRQPSSPMRDVAGMVRSFHYAARVGLLRELSGEVDAEVLALADAWEQHNAAAFVEGYLGTEGVDDILPRASQDRDTLRTAFELDKAVYEVGYEQAHRPEWSVIPTAAVERLVGRP